MGIKEWLFGRTPAIPPAPASTSKKKPTRSEIVFSLRKKMEEVRALAEKPSVNIKKDDPLAASKLCGENADKIADALISITEAAKEDETIYITLYSISLTLNNIGSSKGSKEKESVDISKARPGIRNPLIDAYCVWRGAQLSTLCDQLSDKVRLAINDKSLCATAKEFFEEFVRVREAHLEQRPRMGKAEKLDEMGKKWESDMVKQTSEFYELAPPTADEASLSFDIRTEIRPGRPSLGHSGEVKTVRKD